MLTLYLTTVYGFISSLENYFLFEIKTTGEIDIVMENNVYNKTEISIHLQRRLTQDKLIKILSAVTSIINSNNVEKISSLDDFFKFCENISKKQYINIMLYGKLTNKTSDKHFINDEILIFSNKSKGKVPNWHVSHNSTAVISELYNRSTADFMDKLHNTIKIFDTIPVNICLSNN